MQHPSLATGLATFLLSQSLREVEFDLIFGNVRDKENVVRLNASEVFYTSLLSHGIVGPQNCETSCLMLH